MWYVVIDFKLRNEVNIICLGIGIIYSEEIWKKNKKKKKEGSYF